VELLGSNFWRERCWACGLNSESDAASNGNRAAEQRQQEERPAIQLGVLENLRTELKRG